MYKEDLALNNLQGLICHKAQTCQPKLKWIERSEPHKNRLIFDLHQD